MKYLNQSFRAHQGDLVEVELTGQANVLLMDSANYSKYQRGQPFRYRGGWQKRTPIRLPIPNSGLWVLVVDLGGRAGRVNASARIINN